MDIAGKKIHFMGIGGIGMSALAGIAIDQGATVTGCDRADNEQTAKLRTLGAEISLGHAVEHSGDCDLLVYTSAVPLTHPELVAAGKKALKRGEFLAGVMQGYTSVGICGTHGKTSTTWMAVHILLQNGLDPTVLLGGVTRELAGNYRLGRDIFVSELDESDGSFLQPDLDIGVITNIESEHLAFYKTAEKVVEAFREFAEKNMDGLLIFGTDNASCQELYTGHRGRKVAFGIGYAPGRLYATGFEVANGRQYAEVYLESRQVGRLNLGLVGQHNILNALAALLIAQELGVTLEDGIESLVSLETVQRRMELITTRQGCRIYSDYAHHPTELRAALAGARELAGGGRILAVFQPHLYSRTRDYAAEFAAELVAADGVVLVEIYPAREEPIPGVDSELIKLKLQELGGNVVRNIAQVEEITGVIDEYAGDYSLIICVGAGDIDTEVRKSARL